MIDRQVERLTRHEGGMIVQSRGDHQPQPSPMDGDRSGTTSRLHLGNSLLVTPTSYTMQADQQVLIGEVDLGVEATTIRSRMQWWQPQLLHG